jgi:hypothetical protein
MYLVSLSKLNIHYNYLPARYQTKVVFCSWFFREYTAHVPVHHLTRPSETCNSDSDSTLVFLCSVFLSKPSLLPHPLQSCAHRRTFENSHWLYCSPAEQPDLYILSIQKKFFLCYLNVTQMHCTSANLFGIQIYVLCLMSLLCIPVCLCHYLCAVSIYASVSAPATVPVSVFCTYISIQVQGVPVQTSLGPQNFRNQTHKFSYRKRIFIFRQCHVYSIVPLRVSTVCLVPRGHVLYPAHNSLSNKHM